MKRQRTSSDDDDPSTKQELRDLKELLMRVVEKSNGDKRVKLSEVDVDEEEEEKDQGMLYGLFNLIKPAPVKTESIIAKNWGNKILNGEIKCTNIPYEDAGILTEYTLFVNYPNYLDGSHVIDISPKIPHFYHSFIDLKDCGVGKFRVTLQQCKSPKLIRILDRERLKTNPDKQNVSILGNSGDDYHDKLDTRISKIFSISSVQSPDLPSASERSIKDAIIGVIHRNIDPPITNSDIAGIIDIPLVHSLRFQPEKSRSAIRVTLEIQKC